MFDPLLELLRRANEFVIGLRRPKPGPALA